MEIKALAAHVLRRYDLIPMPGHDAVQYSGPIIGSPAAGIPMLVRDRSLALA